MTKREFLKKIAKEKRDLLQDFVSVLKRQKIRFCIIGGLGVNAYVEPVVSLGLDVVVVADEIKSLLADLRKKYKVQDYRNSINISSPHSDLRIQIQTDARYQDFIPRAAHKEVLGYRLPVAAIEDVLRGKIWAAQDKTRRPSKRQKDLADILRLLESRKSLVSLLPHALKSKLL